MNCKGCKDRKCYVEGKTCFPWTEELEKAYSDPVNKKLLATATALEANFYMQLTRVEEVIRFAQEMEYHTIGIAHCIGLAREAEVIASIFEQWFAVKVVCCKICGKDKKEMDLLQINNDKFEAMCNPVGQAMNLNKEKTDLNLLVGLCVGHDILFIKYSDAPVTTLVVKDRVLAHNPLGVIYSRYYLKNKFHVPGII
ncbi:DUF1847 domain-containing protein [Desulfoscipio sp. XC116]|uniref:DUF1847 domain-containing protein n=1 Tax=Desulfoscipio sp. XC116 TaxID=3144975 RepID=UPI00325BFA8F